MNPQDQTEKDVFEYEHDEETGTVEINTLGSVYGSSIEDYPQVMSRVINILQEVPDASSVVLSESRDYEYDEEQVRLLREISQAIQDISSQGYLSQDIKKDNCDQVFSKHLPDVQQMIFDRMRRDPIGAYVKLRRKERHLNQDIENGYPKQKRCIKFFIQDVIQPVKQRLEQCQLIQKAQPYLTGHHVGDREI
ncbi:MAG: hypothetical protein ABEI78_01530 [Candidatus Nanohaloarchaea archaeon]